MLNSIFKTAKTFFLLLICLIVSDCKETIQFTNKEFTVKGTNKKIILKVPRKCEQFSSSLKKSVDQLKKIVKKDKSLEKIYDKVDLISDFSEGIQAITIAQCKINQISSVYDPNFSDHVFYNELIKSYIEFQKWNDLKTGAGGTTELLDSTINQIYTNLYKNKYEELSDLVNDMALSFNTEAGSTVTVFVNGEMACATVADSKGNATCIVPKKYLLPLPNEITYVKIVASSIGFAAKELNFSLGEVRMKASFSRRINIELI